jgi:hypothetical protein
MLYEFLTRTEAMGMTPYNRCPLKEEMTPRSIQLVCPNITIQEAVLEA